MSKDNGAGLDTLISFAYDADGLRTGKTVTRQAYTHSGDHQYVKVEENEFYIDWKCTLCGETFRGPSPKSAGADACLSTASTTECTGKHITSVTTEEHRYVYTGGLLQQETIITTAADGTQTTQTLTFYYSPDGTPLSVYHNNSIYYYVTNAQGDVMALVDIDGNIVVQYSYDPWGNVLSVTGTLADTLGQLNPLRYRGYVYDSETGRYYNQSRYCNPELGPSFY